MYLEEPYQVIVESEVEAYASVVSLRLLVVVEELVLSSMLGVGLVVFLNSFHPFVVGHPSHVYVVEVEVPDLF